MFNKKTLILGAASALLASGLVGCGGGNAKADLKYWCPSVDNEIMDKLVEEFKKDHSEYADKNIVRDQNYGEGDTYKALHDDLENAADVMLMADDNIRSGVIADEIASVDADKAAFVTETGADAVNACSVDGKMYGYPYRSDNSPLPIYDKTVFTENNANISSLEGMLKACKDAGKKFYLDMGNGWYNAFILWAGGAEFHADKKNGKDYIANNLNEKASAVADVLKRLKALYNEYKDTWTSSSDNGAIEKGFKEGSIGVAFLWNDVATIRAVGGNIGVAAWPSLTINETAVKLKCFRSYKAVVVKEQEDEDRLGFAKAFAKYLASKKAQEARIELQYGPSNLELQKTDAVKKLEFAGKIQQMADEGLTVGQAISVTGDFWTPMQVIGTCVINGIADGTAKAWGDYSSASRAVSAVLEAAWAVK